MEGIKLKITQAFDDRALIGSEGHYSIADVWGESISGIKDPNSVARRIVAAWNYCEGLPTEDIEKMPLPALFFRQAYDGLQKDNSALQHENQCLRAAVAEMQRMLPVLGNLEKHNPGTWSDLTGGTGIETINVYRKSLEAALAQIEKKQLTLQEITAELTENHGFAQETKVQFVRPGILIRVENALRTVEGFPPFLVVKIFNHDAGKYIHLNCPLESVAFFDNIHT